jgi:hypothetical protein
MPRVLALALTLAVGLALGACTAPQVVEVPVAAGSARLGTGETLRVDLGATNASIGDSWHLIGPPDPAVLGPGEPHYETDCDEPGCGGRLSWTFPATAAGTTTVVFRYCYRSAPASCQPQPDRGPAEAVSLTVTVS